MGIRTGAPSYQWSLNAARSPLVSFFVRCCAQARTSLTRTTNRFAQVVNRITGGVAPNRAIRRFVNREGLEYSRRFEKLVDLMCSAARDGVLTGREDEFLLVSRWMKSHSPSRLSTRVVKSVDWDDAKSDLRELLSSQDLAMAITRLDTIGLIVELREVMAQWQRV